MIRAALAGALGLLLALPAQVALAVTEEELQDLENTKPSGDGAPDLTVNAGGGMLRGVLALGAVLLLIILLARWARRSNAKRFVGGGGDGAVEVLSTTPLGPNRAVHLLRVADEVILVGAGESGVTQIRTWQGEEADLVASVVGRGPEETAGELATDIRPLPPSTADAPETTSRRGLLAALRDLTVR